MLTVERTSSLLKLNICSQLGVSCAEIGYAGLKNFVDFECPIIVLGLHERVMARAPAESLDEVTFKAVFEDYANCSLDCVWLQDGEEFILQKLIPFANKPSWMGIEIVWSISL